MIKLVFPHVDEMIDDMCIEATADMAALPPEEIGSTQRVIAVGDGT